MRRRIVPNVTIEYGTATGGSFNYRRGRETAPNSEHTEDESDDDSPGIVEEPAYDPRPPLCKLGPGEE